MRLLFILVVTALLSVSLYGVQFADAQADTTPPSPPSISDLSDRTSSPVTVRGAGENNAVIKIYKAGILITQATTSGAGQYTLTIPLDEGLNTFTATATDTSNNTSGETTFTVTLLSLNPSFSDAQTSYTISFGDALPALTCTDRNQDRSSHTINAVAPSFDSYFLGTKNATYTCTDPDNNTVSHTAAITVVPANNVVGKFHVDRYYYTHGNTPYSRTVSFNFTLNEPLDLGLTVPNIPGVPCHSTLTTDIVDATGDIHTDGCIDVIKIIKDPNDINSIIGYDLAIYRIPDSGPFTFTIPAGLGPETSGIRTAKQSHTFEYVTGQYITLTPSPVDVFTNTKPVIFSIKSDQYIRAHNLGTSSDNGPVTSARDTSPENIRLFSGVNFFNTYTITSNPASDGTVTLSMPSISNIGPFGNSTKPLSFSYVYDTTDPTFATFDSIYYVPTGSASYDLPTIKCEDANTNGSFDADYVSGTVVTTNLNLQKVTYSCTDKAGNSATAEVSFQVSAVEPITATLTAPEFSNKRNVTIQIAFSEPVTGFHATQDVSATNGRVVGGTGSGASAYSVIVRPAADGLVTVTVRENSVTSGVKPFAGAQITFTSDKTPPAAPSITNSTGIVTSSPVSIVGTAENNSVVELFKGGTSVGTTTASSSGAFSFSDVALAEGANSFTAKATDAANNKSPASTAVVITFNPPDTTAPAAPVFSNSTTTRTTPFTLEGTAENGSTVKLYDDGSLIATTTSVSGAFSFTNISLDVGINTFTATATDPVGNISSASSTIIKLIDTPLTDLLADASPDDYIVTFGLSRFDDDSDRILDITFSYAPNYLQIQYFVPDTVGIYHDDNSQPSWESLGTAYEATSSSYTVTHSYKLNSVCSLSGNENVTFTSFFIDTSNDKRHLMQHERVFCSIPDGLTITTPSGENPSSNIIVTGTAQPGASVKVANNSLLLAESPVTADNDGNWSIDFRLRHDGVNNIRAQYDNSLSAWTPEIQIIHYLPKFTSFTQDGVTTSFVQPFTKYFKLPLSSLNPITIAGTLHDPAVDLRVLYNTERISGGIHDTRILGHGINPNGDRVLHIVTPDDNGDFTFTLNNPSDKDNFIGVATYDHPFTPGTGQKALEYSFPYINFKLFPGTIIDDSLAAVPNGILNPTFSFVDYNEDYNSFNVHLKSDVGDFPSDYDFVMFAIQDETVIKSDIDPDTPTGNTLLFSILNSGFDFGKDITFRVEFKTDSGEFYKDYSFTVADLLKISNEKSNPKLKTFTITGSDPLYIAYNDFVENSFPRFSYWYAPDNFSPTTVPPNSDPVQLLNCLDPNIDTYPFVLLIDYEITKTFYAKIIDNGDTPMRECVTTPVFSSESSTYVKSSFSLYVEPVSEVKKKKSGGSSNDWHKKPTFGQSHLTYKQIVDNGFSFNGHSLTITDNWHTDFLLTSSIIGESNTVTIKTYSADPLKWVDLHLGVPRQGGFSEAESHINLVVSRNYTNPVDYTIDEINHYQKENLIDEENTTASVNKVKCQSTDNDEKCYEFTILFTVNAPLMDNVVAISAMDEKRRQHVTYINEGVEFTGESLLDPHTAQLMEKLGNQYDATIIELTQQDRRYNVWEDQHGYLWSQNEYGTWMQTTHPDFERFQDKTSNVMTRQNSNFASLIEHERQKALLVFDSSNIASQVGDYFAYDYSNIDRDTSKLEKYYLELQIENDKAQKLMRYIIDPSK